MEEQLAAMDDAERIVEYPDKRTSVMMALGAAVFVLCGALLIAVGVAVEEKPAILAWIGAASIGFFGLILVYLLYQLVRKQPSLVIDDEGITDHSSYIGGGRLQWEEIRDIRLYEFMGQLFIGLELQDPDAFFARQSPFKKLLMRTNKWMVQAPVNLAQTGVKRPLEELYAIMEDKWTKASARY